MRRQKEEVRMRVQERAGADRECGPRDSVSPGTIHWHGALPGEPLAQVALSYGVTTRMERVTDAQCAAAARK
jgi:hypothetical protein